MRGGRNRFSLVRGLLLAGVLALAAVSCRKDPDEPETQKPVFRSLSAATFQIVIPEGGSAEIEFTVKDAGYEFNYDVSSPSCQLSLRLAGGGSPSAYKLSSVRPSGTKGSYVAVITDLGTDPVYKDDVRLAMASGTDGSVILSSPFTVMSEYAATGKTVVKTGLPVMYIDTEGGRAITSRTEYVPATLSVNGMGVADGLEEVTCQVRGRGNTTWSWSKKPYLIKFDKQQHLFGMHKHKRYVLLANLMDPTLMRNIVAMHVSSLTSLAWTPGCQSVELVLNGRHLGNYLLIEQVRVDKNRVAVSETDGYLLELDFHYDNDIQWISPWGQCVQRWDGIPFGIKYPDSDVITSAQVSYIKDYVERTAKVLYGSNFTDKAAGYAAYIDVPSFIDYWIVFELMINHELGNPGSVFMSKDVDGKLVAGPVWDFDWGVLSYNASPQARTGLVNGKAIWYARLFEDPAFKEAVRKRWNELLPEFEKVPAFIDETEKQLERSAALNASMWDPSEDRSMNGGNIINGDEYLSFHEAVSRIKSIYEERLSTISKNL